MSRALYSLEVPPERKCTLCNSYTIADECHPSEMWCCLEEFANILDQQTDAYRTETLCLLVKEIYL